MAFCHWDRQENGHYGAIYRPPGSSTARGLGHIEEQLQSAAATGRLVIASGDFNLDMLDETEPGTRDFKRILNDLSLEQVVIKATHIHPTPTLLDLAVTYRVMIHLSKSPLKLSPITGRSSVVPRSAAKTAHARPPSQQDLGNESTGTSSASGCWLPTGSRLTAQRPYTGNWRHLWTRTSGMRPSLNSARQLVSQRRPECPCLRDDPDVQTAM